MKIFVLDTSVLLRDPKCLLLFAENTIVIPIEVVDELAVIAARNNETAHVARRSLAIINSLRETGDLTQGVQLQNGGIFRIEASSLEKSGSSDASTAAIETVVTLAREATCPVLLVSQDVATLVRADALGVTGFTLDGKVYEFEEALFGGYTLDSESETYGGYIVLQVPENLRTVFVDILNGFVDFAKLKNYSLALSFASLEHNRIAFRFSPIDVEATVSNQ